jgi:catechol 2,3-dioxygenase-like lactoylglutathione lyase family enzyme
MEIDRIDHVVLTVRDVEATCAFYSRVLGMRVERFSYGRTALHFGRHKLNLQQAGQESTLVARRPTPGSGDLCFITTTPLAAVLAHLRDCAVAVEAGPVAREGATGRMGSVYFRDPDENLVEVANYDEAPA